MIPLWLVTGEVWPFIFLKASGGYHFSSPEHVYARFVVEFERFKYWIWDTFNFETMNTYDAIFMETPNHVFYDPSAGTGISYPAVIFRIKSESADSKTYTVLIYDTVDDSALAAWFKTKFKMAEIGTTTEGNLYKYEYEMVVED